MKQKPECFGTTEYNKGSLICKRCDWFIDCSEVNPKVFRIKHKRYIAKKAEI